MRKLKATKVMGSLTETGRVLTPGSRPGCPLQLCLDRWLCSLCSRTLGQAAHPRNREENSHARTLAGRQGARPQRAVSVRAIVRLPPVRPSQLHESLSLLAPLCLGVGHVTSSGQWTVSRNSMHHDYARIYNSYCSRLPSLYLENWRLWRQGLLGGPAPEGPQRLEPFPLPQDP